MIRPGEVKAVRQLERGVVRADVCLGADVKHGSAVITYESRSPAVLEALANLQNVIREEAKTFVGDVLEGQRDWDKVMTRER